MGATFNHQQWDDVVTTEGIAYLNDKIEQILEEDFAIVSEKAGVRPTVEIETVLRASNTKIGYFNGLGTRGVIQGPYLSAHFTTFLTAEKLYQKLIFRGLYRFIRLQKHL